MFLIIQIIITMMVVTFIFSLAYVWVREDSSGNRIYKKDLPLFATIIAVILLMIVNIRLFM